MKLGIDFGKVIVGPLVNGKADTSFLGGSLQQAMQTLPSPGAFESIEKLVTLFRGEVWIVSKCGPSVQKKTKAWLQHWDCYAKTGLDPQRVLFCLQRHEKAPICRELTITHFVDDRSDVLAPMRGLVPHLYLFGEQAETVPEWTIHTPDWPTALESIAESIAETIR